MIHENNMSDNWIEVNRKPTNFEGRLTISRNNQANTALTLTLENTVNFA